MAYKFTETDRIKSNAEAVQLALDRFLKPGTSPANKWLRKALKEHIKMEYKCTECGISEWMNNPITLEIDHINGDNTDNRVENLRYLCPNCHSQTTTYKGRNVNKGVTKVTDAELLEAYKTEGNIRRTLMKVGLSPRGANYSRMYKILSKQ